MADSNREEIAKLEALYANNPAGRVFTHLAEAYRKAGEYERARGILNEGLQRHPGYASAYVVMGRVLMDLKENDEAGNAFRQVLNLDPHNLVALRSLGELARSAGRSDEAIQYFEELRQHDPGNDEVEGILNDLRNPTPHEPAAEPYAEPDELTTATASRTEEWKATPSVEPEQAGWGEPQQEPAELDALTGHVPDLDRPPEPEPWLAEASADAPEETDTPEAETAFGTEAIVQGFELGWVEAHSETHEETGELGDLSSLSKAAETFEVVGETFDSTDMDLALAPTETARTPEGISEEGEVLTETIAELYRRQGLYDRAVDVYRALLKDRPDDADLLAKLAEVEAMARPAEAAALPDEPWSVRDPWATPEPDAERTAAWMAAGSEPAESAPTPYAWAEQAAEPTTDIGRPIAAYFRDLLGWQPRTVAAQASEAATAAEAFDEWFGAGETRASEETSMSAPEMEAEQPKSEERDEDDDDLEMFRSWLQSLKK